jgi:sulfite dehydrogenase (cytochrome) subunit A
MKFLFLLFLPVIFFSCSSRENSQVIKDPEHNEIRVQAPEKKDMILLAERPPNLETPLHYFLHDYTPNDVFFVRWHLSGLPDRIDRDTFHLRINGHVKRELSLTLNDLRTKFSPFSIVALAQCSGNSRSFFDPKVPGGQWKNGAMGNAKWVGVKVKDLLNMSGLKPGAFEVSFNGMDQGPLPTVPDFVKSLSIDHAMDGEVMVAYEMNGASLPLLNGFPLKLVVPGWYATYWVGMLNEIKVYSDTFKGYWMQKAYLVPKNVTNGDEKPGESPREMVPISKMDVRSIFVSPEPESNIKAGTNQELQGLAFDGGDGIAKVEVSIDGGTKWEPATLDPEIGKYSWRRWRFNFRPERTGTFKIKVKATNVLGETQPEHQWNHSGYMRNEIESLILTVQ